MRYCRVILLLINYNFLIAQSSNLSAYTIKEGLSNNTVLCIKQDSRGFLWVGTQEGLNRFDGYQFKKYFAEKNNKSGLPNDYILDINEYQYGRLLIATSNGIAVLNTITGQFENEKIKATVLKAGSGTIINSIFKDKQSNIWINHNGELDVLDSNLNYLHRFTDLAWTGGLKGVVISLEQWYTDKKGRLWIPSDNSGIHIVDFTGKKIYNAANNPHHWPFLKKQSIRSMAFDEENDKLLYASWGDGLVIYDFKTGLEQQEAFGINDRDESRTINSIIKLSPGNFLFYIGNQCYQYNTNDFQYKTIPRQSISSVNAGPVINSIVLYQLNNKQYWVGTTNGLVMSDNEKISYSELALAGNRGIGKLSDCSKMFISKSGKIYCTYLSNQLVIIENDRKKISAYTLTGKANAIITEACEDQKGNIWIGMTNGFYLFDTVTKKMRQPAWLPADLLSLNCNVLYCDRDGDIWIGSRDPFALYQYNAGNNYLKKINNNITGYFEKQSSSSRVSKIQEDREGNLWMTSRTGGGLIYYYKQKDEWKLYPQSESNFNFLAKKGVGPMFPDDKGFLWFSDYAGDGLIRFDPKKDSIIQFNRNDGLQSNYISSITFDNANTVWLTSEYGVTSFELQEFKHLSTIPYNNFTGDDQQATFDHLTNSVVFSARDKLLFVSTVNKKQITAPPVPIVDRISINNKQSIDPQTSSIRLDHTLNNIDIDFTAAYFSNADKIRFAYMLSGADKDWRYADASRSVQYASLAPGQYTFTIKTSVENGDWGTAYSPFTFTIHPPYWQTWWFSTLMLAVVAGIVILFVRRRIHTIRHESQLKQRIAETEMMALRAQMNPHFIFNCINSIDAMIQSNDKYHATMYLNKFAKLIRNILDSSKQNLVPLSKDIETLQLYVDLEMFRHRNKFKAEINADPQLMDYDYQVPPLIIQPYVENAILHGLRHRSDNDGKLIVNIKKQNGSLNYEITDNGVGRSSASPKKNNESKSIKTNGYGMQISGDRIRLFNNEEIASVQVTDLVDNDKPAGTKVMLQLKIQ